jgi:uncharacterized membrane protein
MSSERGVAELAMAGVFCVMGVAWAGTAGAGPAGEVQWWLVPVVAVVVGPFLVATDRFGRPEHNWGFLVLGGLGILALYGMVFTASVPSRAVLAPLAVGLGVGIGASQLYALRVRPTREQPT